MTRAPTAISAKAPADEPGAIGTAVEGSIDWFARQLGRELRIGDFEISLGSVLLALIALIVLWIGAVILRGWIDRFARRSEQARRAAIYTVSRLTYYTIIVIAVLTALGIAGIPMTKFAVFAGALGVGLGFGLQAIFSNFISGLILLFDRSLKVGDFVELESGVHGEVRDINIRSTLIRTNDNIDILVPNSEFVTGRVTNWTHGEMQRRMRIPFGVAYGSDKELVKKAALEAAEEVAFTLTMQGERGPKVWLSGFGDSSLDFELVVWITAEATKKPSAVHAAYTWALESTLAKYHIEIPFPQRDHHVRSFFGLRGDAALEALGLQRAEAEQPAPADEEPPQLSETERAQLAQNDAQQEVQRTIEAEREKAEREKAEAAAEADEGEAAARHAEGDGEDAGRGRAD